MRAFKEEKYKSALYKFKKSAEMGHELEQFSLGHWYFNGIREGRTSGRPTPTSNRAQSRSSG